MAFLPLIWTLLLTATSFSGRKNAKITTQLIPHVEGYRVYIQKEKMFKWFDQKLHIGTFRPLSGSLKMLAEAAAMLEQVRDKLAH